MSSSPNVRPEWRPTTEYQAMALFLRVVAKHAGTKPALTRFSRALQRSSSFAHMVLQQLTDRKSGGPGGALDERIAVPAFRWFLDPADPKRCIGSP